MSWGRLDDTVHDEPKFFRLAKHLGISFAQATGHVVILWSWAHRHAPDGDLRDFDVPDIERASKWEGENGVFVSALTLDRINLLDEDDHGYKIHAFAERAEARKAAQKKKKQRQKKERPGTDKMMSRDSPGKVPEEKTRQDREDKTEILNTPAGSPAAPSAVDEKTPIAQIQALWFSEYRKKRGIDHKGWGARTAGQAKNLLSDWPLETILRLIPYFFAWQRHEVISAGWQFGRGANCFAMKIGELLEDVNDDERGKSRRAAAGAVRIREKHDERDAFNEQSGQEALRILEEEDRAREAANRIEGSGNGKNIQPRIEPASNRHLGPNAGAAHVSSVVGGVLAGLPKLPIHADPSGNHRATEPSDENATVSAGRDSR